MSLLRGALIELRSLHRVPGPWLPLALCIWMLLVRAQEPAFLRSTGVPFFWESVGAAMNLSFALLPLVWLLGRSPSGSATILRAARQPLLMISISILGIVFYGIEVAVGVGLLGWGLDLLGGFPGTGEPWVRGVAAVRVLAPLAALAPGLAFLCHTAQGSTVTWLVIAAAYTLLLDVGSASAPTAVTAPQILCAVLATAAGLLLSTAVASRRIST